MGTPRIVKRMQEGNTVKEVNYFGRRFMKPFPKIRKNGVISDSGGEPSPFIYQGRMLRLECDGSRGAVIKEYFTGQVLASGIGAEGVRFYVGYCENDRVYVFGTKRNQVYRFVSDDLQNWEASVVLEMPDIFLLFNTSVCRGDGKYMMAIECAWAGLITGDEANTVENPYIGNFFTEFFAESPDLEHWTLLPLEDAYTKERYNACPDLHYCDGYYYMVCLEELPLKRYAPYMYRTRDFKTWEMGMCNPLFIASEEDRHVKPGVVIDPETAARNERAVIVNNSDVGMCEYQGKTYINYVGGDQGNSWGGLICEAVYDGPLEEYLKANFPD